MEIYLFISNFIFNLLFVANITLSCISYIKSKNKAFLYYGLIHFLLLADHNIIRYYNLFPARVLWEEDPLLISFFPLFGYLITLYLIQLIASTSLNIKFIVNYRHYILFFVFITIISLYFINIITYILIEIILLIFLVVIIKPIYYELSKDKTSNYFTFIKRTLILILITSLLILVEDIVGFFLPIPEHMYYSHLYSKDIHKLLSGILGLFFFYNYLYNPQISKNISIGPLNNTLLSTYNLTSREHEVALLVLKNFTNKEISEALNLAEGTVKNYTSKIYYKTEVNNRIEFYQKFTSP